uniref:Membrane protein, putative n=1 Tax=Babesia bovis TaxID=5865 RepID=S6C9A9_BABBO|nr:membrane protein, putative [Babesia bovis]
MYTVGSVAKCSGQQVIYIEDEGPLEIKCTKDQNLHLVDAYGICTEEFVKHNRDATKCDRSYELDYGFKNYCQTVFEKGEPCVLGVNLKESHPSRFVVGENLYCKEGVVFVGLYHCCDKVRTDIAPGEEVTLTEKKQGNITPRCPPGKKINVINSGQRGNILCNKGFVASTLSTTSSMCNGKEMCSVPYSIKPSLKCGTQGASHFIRYTCV